MQGLIEVDFRCLIKGLLGSDANFIAVRWSFWGQSPNSPSLRLARRARCDAPQRNWCLTPITLGIMNLDSDPKNPNQPLTAFKMQIISARTSAQLSAISIAAGFFVATLAATLGTAFDAHAQNFSITAKQRASATQVAAGDGPPTNTVIVSPRIRSETLADASVPTLASHVIGPFLNEAMIVDEAEFLRAPRIVATQEGRVLLSRGDRAYARGQSGSAGSASSGKALSDVKGEPFNYRIFRNATPLKDPTTRAILGYEAQYVGRAELVRGESVQQVTARDGKISTEIVPATIDIVSAKEEMRVGDRLVAETAAISQSYVPRAPTLPISGQIVSVYGSAVTYAAENQVVVINRGSKNGLERGHVMAILKDSQVLNDRTDSARTQIKLPNQRNGLLMVFRTFESLSYALVLQITDGVKVGDRFTNPN